jgi:cytochrome c oxidase subunit IV
MPHTLQYVHQPRPDRFAGTALYQVARTGPLGVVVVSACSLLVDYHPTFLFFFSGQYFVLLYAICAGTVVAVLLKVAQRAVSKSFAA